MGTPKKVPLILGNPHIPLISAFKGTPLPEDAVTVAPVPRDPCEAATGEMIALGPSPLPQVFLVMEETLHQLFLDCIGFRGLGFRVLGFRGLGVQGFRGLGFRG